MSDDTTRPGRLPAIRQSRLRLKSTIVADVWGLWKSANATLLHGERGDGLRAMFQTDRGGDDRRLPAPPHLAATVLGLLAGLAGATLWYLVRVSTGYELGLIAIVVGLIVGVAVRKGSRERGGWFYQTLAIVLTYACIGAQYLPDVLAAARRRTSRKAGSGGSQGPRDE